MEKKLPKKEQISKNLIELKKNIPKDVTLIAVSKTFSFEDIQIAYNLGQRDFAENRVGELSVKSELAKQLSLDDIRWHFIGNIQSNKLEKILNCSNLKMIHSIDRKTILDKLLSSLKKRSLEVDYFLQINTSKEREKKGFSLDDNFSEVLKQSEKKPLGLMTMSKIRGNDFVKSANDCFKSLKEVQNTIKKDLGLSLELSIGMSNDYQIALEYGTHYIRLGTSIFGPRDKVFVNS